MKQKLTLTVVALVESDVLLDLGFPREPFAEEAAQLLEWCRQHTGRGFLAWHSLGVATLSALRRRRPQ